MERKFKVGDKVRVKSLEELRRMGDTDTGFYTKDDVWFNPRMKIYAGFECVVTKHSHIDDKPTYKLSVDAEGWEWSDDMLEDKHIKENIITKIASAIIEAAKEATIIIEQTEDGGIKISPIEEKPQPRKSGIYFNDESKNTYVVFGGGIHVAVGNCSDGYVIGLQELNDIKECGKEHNEEWVNEKPTVNLVINNMNTVKILRDALKMIENKLSKEE